MRNLLSWCLLVGLCLQSSKGVADEDQRVSSVELKRPNIVIRGANLSKVQVWALPTGTGMGDAHLIFGNAARKGAAGLERDLGASPITVRRGQRRRLPGWGDYCGGI